MKGQISREVAFRTLAEIRDDGRKARQRWGIFGYTSKGRLRKAPSDTAETKEEAEAQAANMARLNGKAFVALPLG